MKCKQLDKKCELKIKTIMQSHSFMSLREPLKKAGFKVDYANEPVPHFTINDKGIIVNKKYADESDFEVGDIAYGKI